MGLQSFLLAHRRALEEVQAQVQEVLQAWRPGFLLKRHHLQNDINTPIKLVGVHRNAASDSSLTEYHHVLTLVHITID